MAFDHSLSARCFLPVTHFTDEIEEGESRHWGSWWGTPGVLSRTDEGNFEAGGVCKCECARTTASELSLSGGVESWVWILALSTRRVCAVPSGIDISACIGFSLLS